MKKIASLLLVSTLCVAETLLGQTAGKSFTTGTPISTGGEGWESTVAIDGAGNSIAVWDQRTTSGIVIDKIWTKSHSLSGPWSPKTVLSGALQTTYVFPDVLSSASNGATTIWSDAAGLWTADRTTSGVWGASQLLLPGVTTPMFVMNSKGDAAILWGSGGGRTGAKQLNALRRSAGEPWGTQEIVTTGTQLTYDHAAISDNGDLLLAWETFTGSCPRKCYFSNFVLHVSREQKAVSGWQDSGPLTAADAAGHNAFMAVDPAGHAGAVYFTNNTTLASITQSDAGAGWTSPTTVYSSTGSLLVAGFSTDLNGSGTLALQDFGASTSPIMAVNGSVLTNTWAPPVTVSGNDQSPNQLIYAGGSGGAAVLVWAAGNPNYSNNMIRAAYRPSTSGAWTQPTTISPAGVSMAGPESVAVNASGNAVVIFSAFNASMSVHTEYASTY